MIPGSASQCPGCGALAPTVAQTAAVSRWAEAATEGERWTVNSPDRRSGPRGVEVGRNFVGMTAVATMLVAVVALCWFSFGQGDPFTAVANAGSKRPYVDAMVVSAQSKPAGRALPAQTTRCVASAIVHGYGVSAFAKAGLTPAVLRHAKTTLRKLAAPTAKQVDEIGTAEQLCGVGHELAQRFVQQLHVTDANAVPCLTHVLGTNPNARGYVVFTLLDRDPDLMAAHSVVMAVGMCVDTTRIVLDVSGLRVTPTESACIVATMKPVPMMLDHRLAESMTTQKPTQRQYQVLFAAGIERCVSADRRAQLTGN